MKTLYVYAVIGLKLYYL